MTLALRRRNEFGAFEVMNRAGFGRMRWLLRDHSSTARESRSTVLLRRLRLRRSKLSAISTPWRYARPAPDLECAFRALTDSFERWLTSDRALLRFQAFPARVRRVAVPPSGAGGVLASSSAGLKDKDSSGLSGAKCYRFGSIERIEPRPKCNCVLGYEA